jgi:hypothetical protein
MKPAKSDHKSIPEDFLQYIWRYRLFQTQQLRTATGQQLIILHPGQQNFAAGPDFLNARLSIGDTIWSGHVEIHIRSSDWRRHGHDGDEQYKNVILHAVMFHDEEIFLKTPGDLPVFEMHAHIPEHQLERYRHWLSSKTWISCERHLQGEKSIIWTAWKDRLLVDRLEQKSEAVLKTLEEAEGDWSETFYRKLARNYGFKSNADAMESLAVSLPYKLIQRHKSDPFQILAMLYGQAGMLNELFSDTFPASLQQEYYFMQKKYDLHPLDGAIWNYGRLRPMNFPAIRISQFAEVLCSHDHLLSYFLNNDIDSYRVIFEKPAHQYWNDHYRFDTRAEKSMSNSPKTPGTQTVDNILINTVAVFLFTFGKSKERPDLIENALRILESCKPENNQVIRRWDALGIRSEHSADTQSLIQLYGVYCTARRCLQCAVGIQLLKQNETVTLPS